jgi:hypothetical protein
VENVMRAVVGEHVAVGAGRQARNLIDIGSGDGRIVRHLFIILYHRNLANSK